MSIRCSLKWGLREIRIWHRHLLINPIFLILSSLSKTYPSLLTVILKSPRPSFFDKAGCSRQFESELSLRSFAPFFPIKKGSTAHLGLLPSGEKRKPLLSIVFATHSVPLVGDRNPQGRENVVALWCSEPLRSKVGGPKRSAPCCAGWDRREREV